MLDFKTRQTCDRNLNENQTAADVLNVPVDEPTDGPPSSSGITSDNPPGEPTASDDSTQKTPAGCLKQSKKIQLFVMWKSNYSNVAPKNSKINSFNKISEIFPQHYVYATYQHLNTKLFPLKLNSYCVFLPHPSPENIRIFRIGVTLFYSKKFWCTSYFLKFYKILKI